MEATDVIDGPSFDAWVEQTKVRLEEKGKFNPDTEAALEKFARVVRECADELEGQSEIVHSIQRIRVKIVACVGNNYS